jgi:tetratricopeptide (TPR) repeat protein
LGGEAEKMEVGGTQNTEAYDAYLRGRQLFHLSENLEGDQTALEAFDRACSLDPKFAAAYASRAGVLLEMSGIIPDVAMRPKMVEQARLSAEKALVLAPELSAAHAALAAVRLANLDVRGAAPEVGRAMALGAGFASWQGLFAKTETMLGHHETALAAAQRVVRLDPQSYWSHVALSSAFYYSRRYADAITAANHAIAINPAGVWATRVIRDSYLALGRPERLLPICESTATPLPEDSRHFCLALAYRALDRSNDAERELGNVLRAGDSWAYQFAELYSQWRRPADALRWLATAQRLRDPGMLYLRVDWRLDPIRNEPQFKSIERQLDFPP